MEFKIFGCKTNKYFTEKWLSHPRLAGKKGIFVSSCIVTNTADKKWRKFVLKHLEKNPEDTVFLSGCAPLERGDVRKDFFRVHSEFLPFENRIELLEEDPEDTETQIPKLQLGSLTKIKEQFKEKIYTRKYLVIQTGCDNHCAFCLTVRARGAHNSRNIEEILEEIRDFSEKGGKEVVLTGTNIGAWGSENSNNFVDSHFVELLKNILEKTDIARLRISSLGVEFLSDELLELLKKPRLHAYVHLSIQSGSDTILKKMGRHYGKKELHEKLEKLTHLKREDGIQINIGADLIVGFPDETDDDFRDTLEAVEHFHITNLHAFPFSAHEGTNRVPASYFPEQISEKVKQERWKVLMEAGRKQKEWFFREHDGKTLELLPELPKDGNWRGYSENHIALKEENFTPEILPVVRGKPVKGIYRYTGIPEEEEDDAE